MPPESHDSNSPPPLTTILQQASRGEHGAAERLYQTVYTELRSIAHHYMNHEAPGHLLDTTALVNEAYLRLTKPSASASADADGQPNEGSDRPSSQSLNQAAATEMGDSAANLSHPPHASHPAFENRRHFFGAAAQAMRRLLVDHARSVSAQRRGGRMKKVMLDDQQPATRQTEADWSVLDEALKELEAHDPREAEVVKLRFFTGLTEEQIAHVLDITERTVRRDWVHAKAWLQVRMNDLDAGELPTS